MFAPHPLGVEESAQASYVHAPPAADVRASAEPAAHHDLDAPLGAARAQLHETYILAQTRDGLVIVDQHAAHERLVYEKLKRQRETEGVQSQMLLIPAVVDLDPQRLHALTPALEELAALGLVIEPFGAGAVLVRETPAILGEIDARRLVADIADLLLEDGDARGLTRRLDHVLATCACHHSVRAGRRLAPQEMNALLREMEATPGAGQCNHGRPTYVELKLSDIERLFRQKVKKRPMRSLYRHRQIGWTIIIVVGLAALFAAAASLATPWPTSLLVIAALILTGLLFSSLTIEVTASELVWSFGPGFLKKRVALSGIASAAPARNKWWWGWGVHLTPRGWLYNVDGLDAVEITQKDRRVVSAGHGRAAGAGPSLGIYDAGRPRARPMNRA